MSPHTPPATEINVKCLVVINGINEALLGGRRILKSNHCVHKVTYDGNGTNVTGESS